MSQVPRNNGPYVVNPRTLAAGRTNPRSGPVLDGKTSAARHTPGATDPAPALVARQAAVPPQSTQAVFRNPRVEANRETWAQPGAGLPDDVPEPDVPPQR